MNRLQGRDVQATGCTNSQRNRNVFSAVLKALTVSIACNDIQYSPLVLVRCIIKCNRPNTQFVL